MGNSGARPRHRPHRSSHPRATSAQARHGKGGDESAPGAGGLGLLSSAAGVETRSPSTPLAAVRRHRGLSPRSHVSARSSATAAEVEALPLKPRLSMRMRQLARASIKTDAEGTSAALGSASDVTARNPLAAPVHASTGLPLVAAEALASSAGAREKALQQLASALDVGAKDPTAGMAGPAADSAASLRRHGSTGSVLRAGASAANERGEGGAEEGPVIHTGTHRYHVDEDPRHRFLHSKRSQLALMQLV